MADGKDMILVPPDSMRGFLLAVASLAGRVEWPPLVVDSGSLLVDAYRLGQSLPDLNAPAMPDPARR